jgi:hypothetical protein
MFRPKAGTMRPAPSGLQEVDGLNHLLGNPYPDRYFVRAIYLAITSSVTLPQLDLVLPAYIPDQISHPLGHVSTHCRPSIFRYPYQMQMDLEKRMRAVLVICHPPSLVPGARAEAVA